MFHFNSESRNFCFGTMSRMISIQPTVHLFIRPSIYSCPNHTLKMEESITGVTGTPSLRCFRGMRCLASCTILETVGSKGKCKGTGSVRRCKTCPMSPTSARDYSKMRIKKNTITKQNTKKEQSELEDPRQDVFCVVCCVRRLFIGVT